MKLKEIFNRWASSADKSYTQKQWVLSKWEIHDGILWPAEKIELMLKSIVDGLDLAENQSVADLGCGGGWILKALQSQAKDIIGLDLSSNMLKLAKEITPQGKFVCAELGFLPFRSQSFDRVLSYFVFINITDDEYIFKSILEMHRVLKRGGRALIGQLPDKDGSKKYDEAKQSYLAYCAKTFDLGKDIRDQELPPLRLFDKGLIRSFLKQEKIPFRLIDSFNPFYRSGEPALIPWRFDLVLEKP